MGERGKNPKKARKSARDLALDAAAFPAALSRLLDQPDLPLSRLLDQALEEALALTGSAVGYIFFYDEKSRLFSLHSWSSQVMPLCLMAERQTVYHLDRTGIWGEAVRQRRPILVNDLAAPNPLTRGFPEGHVVLRNFLSVPVFDGAALVAVVGVGNRWGDYTPADVDRLDLYIRSVWLAVGRLRIRERLRIVTDHSESWEFWRGEDGDYRWVSPACEAVCGYPPERLSGLHGVRMRQMVHPEDKAIWEAHLRDLESLQPVRRNFEFRILTASGEVAWIAHACQPVFGDDGRYQGRRGVNRDITELKRAQQELAACREALAGAGQAKSEFLANMSHEIRTPLNGIMGMLQLLDMAGLSPEHREMVGVALGASRTLGQIIADILDLSRFERGLVRLALGPVDPVAVAAGVAASFRGLPGKEGLHISACAGPHIPGGLLGDTVRLRQVLFNLVGNAVKFTRQGRVEVEVHFLSRVRDRVHLLFRVRDTGVGIAADQMEMIFEPFIQGDGSLTRRFGGAGLGLAIARKLVELMDGHILIESEPGQGTSVDFTAALRAGIGAEAGPLGLERVLVVGDAAAREPVEAFLEALGLGHASLDEASRVLEVLDQGDFDAVVLDVPFPAPDGATPARVIRDSGLPCRALPIVAVTGCARMDEAWLREAGITDCLSRPVTLTGLEEALRRALDRVRRGG